MPVSIVMQALTDAEKRGNTMKKFDIAGSAIYAGLAMLGVGSVTTLMVVVLLNIIFGA